jgi:uncharacterized protein (UPF0261 family)
MASAAQAVMTPRKPPVSPEIRKAIIDRLQSDPSVSHVEIAAEAGVSHDFVDTLAKRLNGQTVDESDKRAKQLARQIGKRLSVADRAMIYEKIARGDANAKSAFSQAAVLKRIEELEGIVTAKEKREVTENTQPTLPPMFVLPSDTNVDIGVAIKVRARK